MSIVNDTVMINEMELYQSYFHLVTALVLFAIFGIYIWLVLIIGPEFMKTREPFNVIFLIRLYNAFQVFVCSVFVIRAHQIGLSFKYVWKCERFLWLTDLVRLEIKIGLWLFLVLRIVEFIETIFFVVRKKQKQASFLHIFHHIGSVLMAWLFIVSGAELMGVYIALINFIVHFFMYLYYFLSSFPNKKLLSILRHVKPLITIVQMVQFGIVITHCVIAILPDCNCNYFFHLTIVNFIVLTFLFGKFFVETYLTGSKKKLNNNDYQMAQT